MKEIVVVSGKGGVGKSAITASLGHLWAAEGHRVALADTDVDAPNLHLTLGARLTGSEEVQASEKAFIDGGLCSGCGECLTVCRFSSIIQGEVPIVVRFSCEGCGACAITCPAGAIAIRRVTNGRINVFDAAAMPVVGGELLIGESSSGMLVDLVKERARAAAATSRAEALLIDGPPGIGCPVIAAVRGADYVVAVTEPTPAALHDLDRIVKVIGHFHTPLGIVLNKADIHPASKEALMRYAARNGLPILVAIPYGQEVPLAIAEARPVVAAFPDAPCSRMIRRLAESLESTALAAGEQSPLPE